MCLKKKVPAEIFFGPRLLHPLINVWGLNHTCIYLVKRIQDIEPIRSEAASFHLSKIRIWEGKSFKVGDRVLLETHYQSNKAAQFSAKLVPRYVGAFVIRKFLIPVTVLLEEENNPNNVVKGHLSQREAWSKWFSGQITNHADQGFHRHILSRGRSVGPVLLSYLLMPPHRRRHFRPASTEDKPLERSLLRAAVVQRGVQAWPAPLQAFTVKDGVAGNAMGCGSAPHAHILLTGSAGAKVLPPPGVGTTGALYLQLYNQPLLISRSVTLPYRPFTLHADKTHVVRNRLGEGGDPPRSPLPTIKQTHTRARRLRPGWASITSNDVVEENHFICLLLDCSTATATDDEAVMVGSFQYAVETPCWRRDKKLGEPDIKGGRNGAEMKRRGNGRSPRKPAATNGIARHDSTCENPVPAGYYNLVRLGVRRAG
ncbi:hypothetical protein PR048_018271 [Dryococelus australis]|uniref:Uncharacterized protein n=1 Tax=Dryococelus australis TaxID=614101 RepID=A0ABQ9HC17_9NEOP|nr:hypothetical protein PR048_018271 [Dryococelus australis]